VVACASVNGGVCAGWLAVMAQFRSVFRNWHRFFCTVRPGMIVYYKDAEQQFWAGTILLRGGQVIERPTKMGGFGFKFFHPLKHSIHALKVR